MTRPKARRGRPASPTPDADLAAEIEIAKAELERRQQVQMLANLQRALARPTL